MRDGHLRSRWLASWLQAAVLLIGIGATTVHADPAAVSSLPWRFVLSGPAPVLVDGSTAYFGNAYDPFPVGNELTGLAIFPFGDGVPEAAPVTNERVYVAIADGAGGWYIGGDFTTVGGVVRGGLAHLLPNGTVDPAFVADVAGSVRALVLNGTQLIVGGGFSTVNLVPRANVAIVSAATGAVHAAAPAIDGVANALVLVGSTLVTGGSFSTAGGQPRVGLAAFNVATGALVPTFTANTPNVGSVRALAADGTAIYAGGSFTTINGVARTGLVKIDAATGFVDPSWNPAPNSTVNALAVTGGTVFAGGAFGVVGGQPRLRVAALNTSNGAALPWRADADGTVYGLSVDSGVLHVVGAFGTLNAVGRRRAAAVSTSTPATVLPWNPSLLATPLAVTTAGGRVAVVGATGPTLGAWGVQTRQGLLAIDLVTGELLPWAPSVNGLVYEMTAAGQRLIVAGSFTTVDGNSRTRLAAFDLDTGALLPFNVTMDGTAAALAVLGNVLYIGGSFSVVNGALRVNLAAVDLTTGAVLPWDPQADSGVSTLVANGDRLLVGGAFTSLIGASGITGFFSRTGLGEITTAGAVTSLDAGVASGHVRTMTLRGTTLYFGGSFAMVRGAARGNAAAIDVSTGALLPWNPGLDAEVDDLSVHRGSVYLAGSFTTAGGQAHAGVARVNDTTGAASAWGPLPAGDRAFGVLASDRGVALGSGPVASFTYAQFYPEQSLGGQPGPPAGATARSVGATVSLAWQPPVSGPRPASYRLEAGTAPGLANIATLPIATTGVTVGGVPAGTYYARVRAVGAAGPGAASRELAFVVGAAGCTMAPSAVAPPSVVVTGGSLFLNWTPGGGATPAAYTLLAGTASGVANVATLALGAATTFSTTGVPPGAYFVRVVAQNACGSSVPSADAVVRVGGVAGPPGVPLQVAATTGPGSVALSWQPSTAGGVPTSHVLEAGSGPGLSNIAVVPLGAGTSFAAGGVPAGTYYLRVRALNGAGPGPASGEVVVIVP